VDAPISTLLSRSWISRKRALAIVTGHLVVLHHVAHGIVVTMDVLVVYIPIMGKKSSCSAHMLQYFQTGR
jgi:hypothetical protein